MLRISGPGGSKQKPQLASTPQLIELCHTYQQHALSEQVELSLGGSRTCQQTITTWSSPAALNSTSHLQFDIEFDERLASLQRTLKQEIRDNWKEGLPLPLLPSVYSLLTKML